MSLLLNAIVTGIAIGAVYGLIAMAYSVVFVATRVFNLAQGDLVMVGVLVSFWAIEIRHWPQVVALLVVIGVVCALSLVEERIAVRPFLGRGVDDIGWFISTLAFGLVIATIATNLYGNRPPLPVASPLTKDAIRIGSVTTTPQLLLAFATLVLVTVLLELFYRRTWLGHALRGTAEDREVAALRGISAVRMSRIAFLLGGVIAGLAAFVIAPVVYADVSLGLSYSIKGFVALAVGGFGSTRGALAGALSLGVAEQVFDLYADPHYELLAALLLLLVVLTVRPHGIFGSAKARTV
ncbi:MAG: branched-chain amino acid ABC transporter permease [Nocardioidaceae bacterium]|nr:branched-chain amino acid ABC transporter permease [Nocardioidaceae bacterium]